MNAPDIVVYQVPDLLRGPVHPDPFQILIAAGSFNGLQQPASSAILIMPCLVVIGMIPAMIGMVIWASSHRSQKS